MQKKKKNPTYLPNQKIQGRVTANKQSFKDGLVKPCYDKIYMVDRELVFPKSLDRIIAPWLNHVMVRYIYMVERELVFPKGLDKIIPPWLNHVMVIYGRQRASVSKEAR